MYKIKKQAPIYLIALTLTITSCATRLDKVFKSKKLEDVGITKSIIKADSISLSYPNLDESLGLRVHYLGCGGVYIVDQKDGILIDPFFSNYKFLQTRLKKMVPQKNDIKYGFNRIDDLHKSKAIFISHSHYDHLFDTPYIVENHIKRAIDVYGSSSTKNILKSVLDSNYLNVLPNPAVCLNDSVVDHNWIAVGENYRVLPIQSEHGPHFRLLVPFKLFSGEVDDVIKGYNHSTAKTGANKWKEGNTYSFLIDKLSNGKTVFRIFIQSSASKPTLGFPPQHILDQKKVDLAIIGAASFSYIKGKNYPWRLIKYLEPKQLLICHWEDFFRPYQESPKRFVRFTNFKKFLYQLDQEYRKLYSNTDEKTYFLAEPRTIIHIK